MRHVCGPWVWLARRANDRVRARLIVEPSDEEVRDAVILRFEYCYEFCWKMLKRQLEQELPNPRNVQKLDRA